MGQPIFFLFSFIQNEILANSIIFFLSSVYPVYPKYIFGYRFHFFLFSFIQFSVLANSYIFFYPGLSSFLFWLIVRHFLSSFIHFLFLANDFTFFIFSFIQNEILNNGVSFFLFTFIQFQCRLTSCGFHIPSHWCLVILEYLQTRNPCRSTDRTRSSIVHAAFVISLSELQKNI